LLTLFGEGFVLISSFCPIGLIDCHALRCCDMSSVVAFSLSPLFVFFVMLLFVCYFASVVLAASHAPWYVQDGPFDLAD
jgi:hypothetical protein